MMKKVVRKMVFFGYVCSLLVLTACGGRVPNPVSPSQYGDQEKNCDRLEFEMAAVQGEMARLLPKTDKTGKNVALGVAGWFVVVPWLFMDFKDAEGQEYRALQKRYTNLAALAIGKKCAVRGRNE